MSKIFFDPPKGLTLLVGLQASFFFYNYLHTRVGKWDIAESQWIRYPGDWKKIDQATAIEGLGGHTHPSYYSRLCKDLSANPAQILATTNNPALLDHMDADRVWLAESEDVVRFSETPRFLQMKDHASLGEIWMAIIADNVTKSLPPVLPPHVLMSAKQEPIHFESGTPRPARIKPRPVDGDVLLMSANRAVSEEMKPRRLSPWLGGNY